VVREREGMEGVGRLAFGLLSIHPPKRATLFFEGKIVGENPNAIFINYKVYVQDIYKRVTLEPQSAFPAF
jgi:hypothetical protein